MPIVPTNAPAAAVEAVRAGLVLRATRDGFSLPNLSKTDPRYLRISTPHRLLFLSVTSVKSDMDLRKAASLGPLRFLVVEVRGAAKGELANVSTVIAVATAAMVGEDKYELADLNE